MTGKHSSKKTNRKVASEERSPGKHHKQNEWDKVGPADIDKPEKARRSKRKIWFGVGIAVLVLITGAAFLYLRFGNTTKIFRRINLKNSVTIQIPPRITYCPICGKKVTNAAYQSRRPLLIKVENITEARPQSGLDKADVIYEAMAEGGITRFAVLYYCQDADEIGPVRSARLQDIDLIAEYDALFAHVGGSDTFNRNATDDIGDLDQFVYDDAYWRTDERYAPHNVYTSTKKLWNTATDLGINRSVSLAPFMFTNNPVSAVKADFIDIPYNSNCDTHYEYDPATKTYLRSIAGEPHIDLVTEKRLAPTNVVIQYVDYLSSDYGEEYGLGGRQIMELVGQGRVQIFVNGYLIEGTWMKASQDAPTQFVDGAGTPISFGRGQIWIEIIPSGLSITFSPASQE